MKILIREMSFNISKSNQGQLAWSIAQIDIAQVQVLAT
jgi:hypothetical protein